MSGETIFDKIIAKNIPAKIVFEDECALAFHDVNPQAPVHVLVIPKKKIRGIAEADKMGALDFGEYMLRVARVATLLGLDQYGYRVVFNNGQHGQQTVDYIHAHILGGRAMSWPPG